jgi:hypothetical protein
MGGEGTIRDRARTARDRKREAHLRQRLAADRVDNGRLLPLVNRLLGTQLTVDDLQQTDAELGQGRHRVEYRFKVDRETFALTDDGGLHVLQNCAHYCGRLAETGQIRLLIPAAIEETGGDGFDTESALAELALLLDAKEYCWYHRRPDEPEHSELEARVRQIVWEEIDKAGLVDDAHDHNGYADERHTHYEFANRDHDHDGQYAEPYHYH